VITKTFNKWLRSDGTVKPVGILSPDNILTPTDFTVTQRREAGIVTRLWVGYQTNQGSNSGGVNIFTSYPNSLDRLSVTHSPIFNKDPFVPRAKWLYFKAELSALYIAEVKNEWIYTSTPPYAFMSCNKVILL
jgi:hypothetical protein